LAEYYPTALEAFEDWGAASAWMFLQRFSTPQLLEKAGKRQWEKFLHGRTGQSLRSKPLESYRAAYGCAILQVFEQRGRAGSSPDKAANPADARIQAIRDGGRDDPRHRTGGESQETTVQPQTTNRTSYYRSSALGGDPGRIKPRKSFSQKTYIYRIFAPELPKTLLHPSDPNSKYHMPDKSGTR
jgi:hypothetical protein